MGYFHNTKSIRLIFKKPSFKLTYYTLSETTINREITDLGLFALQKKRHPFG